MRVVGEGGTNSMPRAMRARLSETGAVSRDIDGLTVTLLPARPYETRHVTAGASLGVAIGMQHGEDAIGSDRVRPFLVRPWTLARLPPGCDVYSRSPTGGEYLKIEGVPEGRFDAPFSDARVPGVRDLARELRLWVLGAGPHTAERPRALGRLLGLGEHAGRASGREPGALDARRLRRTLELVEADLARALPVGELATRVGLSEDHFARAFRRATGCTPHRYVVQRRLQRAWPAVRAGDAPLVEIALACGFASHAHFSRAFRAEYGCPPGALRARFRKSTR